MLKKPVRKKRVGIKLVLMLFVYLTALFAFRLPNMDETYSINSKVSTNENVSVTKNKETLNQYVDLTYNQHLAVDNFNLSTVQIGFFYPSLAIQIYKEEIIMP